MVQSTPLSETAVNLWSYLPGYIWVTDNTFKLVAISAAYLELIEEKQADIIGKDIFTVFQNRHAAHLVGGLPSLKYSLEKVRITGQEEKVSAKIDRFKTISSSDEQISELLYRPVLGKNGLVDYIIHEAKVIGGNLEDINASYNVTGQKLAGEVSEDYRNDQKTEQLHEEQGKLLELIARGSELNDILKSLCLTISRINDGVRAAILLADDERATFKRPIAPELFQSFGEELEGAPINDLPIGTCGEAVFKGKPVICEDVANDGKWSKAWRDLCIANGILACYSDPIFNKDNVSVGSFMLCFSEKRKPNKWEQQLAGFGTYVASIALDNEQSRKTLRVSEERYRTLFNSIDEAFALCEIVLDNQGKPIDYKFLEVNPAFEKITGITAKNAINKTAKELVPGIEDWWIETYGKVVAAGESLRFENTVEKLDTWYDVYAFSRGNGQFGILFKDISKQKQRERALRESEERFRLATEAGHIYSWEIDVHTLRFQYSDNAAELIGFQKQSELPATVEEKMLIVHKDDRDWVLKQFEQALAEAETFKMIYRVVNHSNDIIWLEKHGRIIRDSSSKPIRVIGVAQNITERKGAEDALQALKTRLADDLSTMTQLHELSMRLTATTEELQPLLEEVLDATIKLQDADFGNVQLYNRETGALQIVAHRGFDQEFLDFFSNLDIERSPWAKAVEQRERYIVEDITADPDATGHKQLFASGCRAFQSTPLFNRAGDLLGVLSTHFRTPHRLSSRKLQLTDLYARQAADLIGFKLAEEKLKDSQMRLKLSMETAGLGSWELDLQTEKLICSDSCKANFGLSPDTEFTYTDLYNSIHPDDRKEVREVVEYSIATDGNYNMEYRTIWPDGSMHWIMARGRVFYTPENLPLRLIGVTLDITTRKNMEEALRQNEKYLHMIMESAKDYAIITTDVDRNIIKWNAGAERLLGYKEEEIIGRSGDIIFTEEDQKEKVPEKEFGLAVKKGQAENERWHVRKDGTRFWGSGISMPLHNGDDKLRGFLKIMRDNTEKMRMEKSLKKAKESAEKAARAKEEFLAHMSHEIRTPLNAIVGLSNLLLQREPREDQAENLQALKFSSENLMNLVNDILDFSKLEAGKVSFEEAEFDLQVLLHNLKQAHEFKAREKAIQLQLKVDEKIPHIVKGDQLKISQILNNLVSNAIKFTHNGSVIMEISLRKQEEDIIWLDFSVSDTGIGISQEKLSFIFEKFTQADSSTVRHYGGTGLGLTITKMLLELMGSSIQVESDQGKGSRFFFELQLKSISTPTASPTKKRMAEEVTLNDVSILLVEDVEINRIVIMQFLKSWWNLVPDEAVNGLEAIEKVKQKRYDLILMDIRMPEMDGYQASAQIRTLPDNWYRSVPVIALTADTRQDFRKDEKASYFTDIIIKPFDPNDLKQKIIKYTPHSKITKHSQKAPSFSPHKIEDLLNPDKEAIISFYEKANQHLNEYKQIYKEAMIKRDIAKLGNLKHKMSVLMDMMNMELLKDLLEKSYSHIEEKIKSDIPAEIIDEGEALFSKVAEALKMRKEEIEREI